MDRVNCQAGAPQDPSALHQIIPWLTSLGLGYKLEGFFFFLKIPFSLSFPKGVLASLEFLSDFMFSGKMFWGGGGDGEGRDERELER